MGCQIVFAFILSEVVSIHVSLSARPRVVVGKVLEMCTCVHALQCVYERVYRCEVDSVVPNH